MEMLKRGLTNSCIAAIQYWKQCRSKAVFPMRSDGTF